jgi:putative ABC transport system permease protein
LARFIITGRPRPATGEEARALVRAVSPGYFDTLSIRRLAGRPFTDADIQGSPGVAIVNETLARRVFPGENPIGKEIEIISGTQAWVSRGGAARAEIVGVVSNAKDAAMNEISMSGLYLPFAQRPSSTFQTIVHASVPPDRVVEPLRNAVRDLDPRLPLLGVSTMTERVDAALRQDRFNLLLIAAFATVAVVVASIGIFGAMSYAIHQRTAEFGVRLALGSTRRDILARALGLSIRLGAAGIALGLVLSLVLAAAIGNALYTVQGEHSGILFDVSTTDPLTLAGACGALLFVAALAGAVPARRAMRVNPLVALRSE